MTDKRFGRSSAIWDSLRINTLNGPQVGASGAGDAGMLTEGPGIDIVTSGVSAAVGVALDSILVAHSNGDPATEYAADSAGVAAAFAAYVAGDVFCFPVNIKIGLTSGITVPAGATLRDFNLKFSGYAGIGLTLADGCSLHDGFVDFDGAGQSLVTAIGGTGLSYVYAENVYAQAYDAATNVAWDVSGLVEYIGVNLEHCVAYARDGGTAYGMVLGDFAYAAWCDIGAAHATTVNYALVCQGSAGGRTQPVVFACWCAGNDDGAGATSYGAIVSAGKYGQITSSWLRGGTDGLVISAGAVLEADNNYWSSQVGSGTITYAAGDRSPANHTHGAGASIATDTLWDALGDLAVGTGADTAARLPVGADGLVLSANSATATGLEWVAAAGGSSLGWFNVMDYGAVGDAVADDTSAINAAIAALNAYFSSTGGVLYFPGGTYKTTGNLTAITVRALILGDGSHNGPSVVTSSSTTNWLFTVTGPQAKFQGVMLQNVAGGAKTAGAGIIYDPGASGGRRCDFEDVSVSEFYINIDIRGGGGWSMHNAYIYNPYLYGLRIANVYDADEGDWSISNTSIIHSSHSGAVGLRIQSAGGGKIVNTKFNGAFDYSLNLATADGTTGILLVSNCSFESSNINAIRITAATHTWRQIIITGCQFGMYSSTGPAIYVNATSLGQLQDVIIDNCAMRANSSISAAAISFTNVQRGYIAGIINECYTSLFVDSGSTDVGVFVVDGSIAPANNDVMTYDSSTGMWGPAASAGGGVMASDVFWDALGDLAAGTGANAAARLPVGTDGQILEARSTEATGLKWITPPVNTVSGGGVAQVARYTTNAGQSISNATATIVNFEDVDTDVGGLVTTGASWKFTAPEAGYYLVNAKLLFASSAAWGVGEAGELYLYKNNAYVNTLERKAMTAAATHLMDLQGTDIILLAAGDYIDIRVYQSSASTIALFAGGDVNWVSIAKVDVAGGDLVYFTQTATATVANTTTETTLAAAGKGTLPLPANRLVVGRELRLDVWGVLSSLGAAPGTLNIKVKLGATLIISTGAVTLTASLAAAVWHLEAKIVCRTIGATGTVMGQGKLTITNGLVDIVEQLSNGTSTVTVDTTASKLVDVTATFGTANAANTISATNLALETLN
jgi:hypothetical protein